MREVARLLILGVILAGLSPAGAEGAGTSGWTSAPGTGTKTEAPSKKSPGPVVRFHPDAPSSESGGPSRSTRPTTSPRPRFVSQEKIRVVDGDTIRIGRERVRIIGFDAPEMSQPRGPAAKARLDQLLRGGTVTMMRHGKDKYGRTLALVYVNGKNVAEIMRDEGFVK
jgi:endonuclease YncB( thermonuclease family)